MTQMTTPNASRNASDYSTTSCAMVHLCTHPTTTQRGTHQTRQESRMTAATLTATYRIEPKRKTRAA